MFDRFAKEKSDFLGKKDKSKKGCIDEGIKEVIKSINSKNDFYTTSSCSGRIVLIEMRSSKKYECHWILAKHEKAKFGEISGALTNHKSNNEVWLKQQPLILHVACRNLDAGRKLLGEARKIFRRAGIIGFTDNKIVVEIIGSEYLETLIKKGRIIPDEKYLKELIKTANRNFVGNKIKIWKFGRIIKKI